MSLPAGEGFGIGGEGGSESDEFPRLLIRDHMGRIGNACR